MKRMIIAVVISILLITVFIITYSVVVWPLEYVVDGLLDVYPSIPNTGVTPAEATNTLNTLPMFLAGALVVGIASVFIWLFAFAHKKEYEKY